MSDKEINQLPLADAFTGNEKFPLDKPTGASPDEHNSRHGLLSMLQAYMAGQNTFFTPAGTIKEAGTNGAAKGSTELRIGVTDEYFNFDTLDFDWLADEFANLWAVLPNSWDKGTLTFRVVWTTTGESNNGIAFYVRAVAVGDGEPIASSYGTAIGVTDNAQSAGSPSSFNELYVSDESAALTINGTLANNMGSFFQMYRDVSHANDDLLADMKLLGIIWKFNANTLKDD